MPKNKWVDKDGNPLEEKDGNDLTDDEFYEELQRWTKNKKVVEENEKYIYTKYVLVNGFIEHYIEYKKGYGVKDCVRIYATLLAKKKINEGITLIALKDRKN
ncbi:hypothetical protein [[Mycoplasma] testudinis]|uniref:hypothetical protein n=1 Tax=[Mycoplasma] testudinis TaxID=33924 RepID=UPI00048309EB|nr:hypothetical protein [[Mycoplasma] testudinis]